MTAEEGTEALAARFAAVRRPLEYYLLIDAPRTQTQIKWLRLHRPDLWARLRPVQQAAYRRIYPEGALAAGAARTRAQELALGQERLL